MGMLTVLAAWWLSAWLHYAQHHIATVSAHDAVTSMAVSPDQRFLVSGGANGEIGIWSSDDYRRRATLHAHRGAVNALSFSHDGAHLVSGGADGVVHLWEFKSRRRERSIAFEARPVTAVALLPGSRLVAAESPMGVIVADLDTEENLFALDGLVLPFRSLQLSPNGETIYTAGFHDKFPRSWDAQTGAEKMQFQGGGYSGRGYTVTALSPDGKVLATGTAGWSVVLWCTRAGVQRCDAIKAHWRPVTGGLGFSPDGRHLASCDASGTALNPAVLKIWSVETCQLVGTRRLPRRFADHDAVAFTCVTWLARPSRIVSGHADGSLRIWRAP